MKSDEVIDLDPKRREKQLEYDQALIDLYEDYFSFLRRHANIREKVRAKHMFREKTGLDQNDLFEKAWDEQFEHWFAFDYRNIQGTLMFDLYFHRNKNMMSETMFVLSALLFTTVIEPIIVKDVYNSLTIEGENPLEETAETIHSVSNHSFDVKPGDLVFMRKIKSGYRMTLLGPYHPIDGSKKSALLSQVHSDYKAFMRQYDDTTFRTFFRAHAVTYLNYKG